MPLIILETVVSYPINILHTIWKLIMRFVNDMGYKDLFNSKPIWNFIMLFVKEIN